MIAIIIKKQYANRQTCGHLHTFLVTRTHLLIFTGTLVYIIYCILPCLVLSWHAWILELVRNTPGFKLWLPNFKTEELTYYIWTNTDRTGCNIPFLRDYTVDHDSMKLTIQPDHWISGLFQPQNICTTLRSGLLPSHSQASGGLPTQMPGQI